jgi:hypothetical protein
VLKAFAPREHNTGLDRVKGSTFCMRTAAWRAAHSHDFATLRHLVTPMAVAD